MFMQRVGIHDNFNIGLFFNFLFSGRFNYLSEFFTQLSSPSWEHRGMEEIFYEEGAHRIEI